MNKTILKRITPKKLCNLTVVMLLFLFLLTQPVLASSAEYSPIPSGVDATNVTPDDISDSIQRASLCDDCRIGYIVSSATPWGTWGNDHEVKCSHYPYGTDMIQKRYRTRTYRCSYCGASTSRLESESRSICHGYHK